MRWTARSSGCAAKKGAAVSDNEARQSRARLLEEQLAHAVDLMNSRFDVLEGMIAHQEALAEMRLKALEAAQTGQETRLRKTEESVVRLTALTNLAQVGQAAFALILSALAAYLGSR